MNVESIFREAGGEFVTPFHSFKEKLDGIKAFIFDWDGVFNDGYKDHQASSNFSEVDAMGTNLLRFSRWLDKKVMPFTAIMSGERNQLSFQFTIREHFHQAYFKVVNKKFAFEHFIKVHSLKPEEVAFIFDDVLDLSIASVAGIRILINRKSNPLFKNYVIGNKLADYVTGASSGEFAVRELCELLIGVTGNYNKVVENRFKFSADYKKYLEERQAIDTGYFTWKDNLIQHSEID
jgi:3-deoxy-D-manno-octulosonate 8-phosphate phosphatase (KDO 8-P phosphatase)